MIDVDGELAVREVAASPPARNPAPARVKPSAAPAREFRRWVNRRWPGVAPNA